MTQIVPTCDVIIPGKPVADQVVELPVNAMIVAVGQNCVRYVLLRTGIDGWTSTARHSGRGCSIGGGTPQVGGAIYYNRIDVRGIVTDGLDLGYTYHSVLKEDL